MTFLSSEILGEEVMVIMDSKNRVGKFGRLIGDIWFRGMSMSELMLREQKANVFGAIQ